MNRFSLFFAVLFVLAVSSISFAAPEKPLTLERPSIMESVEALGMGGAYYGLSNSKYASFYNPAGLKYVEHYTVDILPVAIGINKTASDSGQDVYDIYSDNSKSDNDRAKELINTILGKYINVAPLNFFPAFTKKNFTLGAFTSNEANIVAYNEADPMIDFRVKSDSGLALSMATQFLDNDALSVGFTVKGFQRINFTKLKYGYEKVAGLISDNGQALKDLTKEIEKDGTGYAVLGSVGVIYEVPSFGLAFLDVLKPRVAASFNDFGYRDFGNLMEDIDPTLNLAFSVHPQFSSFMTTDLMVDFTDVTMNAGYDKSFLKRLNAGLQIGFWQHIFLRTGLHQGYFTFGAGFDAVILRVNYAYYSEELGAYAGQHKDTRHAIEVTLGF